MKQINPITLDISFEELCWLQLDQALCHQAAALDRALGFVSELATADSHSGSRRLFEHSSLERRRLKGAKLRCLFDRHVFYSKPTARS